MVVLGLALVLLVGFVLHFFHQVLELLHVHIVNAWNQFVLLQAFDFGLEHAQVEVLSQQTATYVVLFLLPFELVVNQPFLLGMRHLQLAFFVCVLDVSDVVVYSCSTTLHIFNFKNL